MIWILVTVSIVFLLAVFTILFWSKKQVDQAKSQLEQTFQSLSFEVLQKSQSTFLEMAKTTLDKYQEGAKADLDGKQKVLESLLTPVKESLKKLDEQHRDIEKRREGAYHSLHKQIEHLVSNEKLLRAETSNLVRALKSPNVRGSWGQLHLRRVVELAGMLNHCDFYEQKTLTDGTIVLRPDVVVRLPGDRQIVVDAKTPTDAYVEAVAVDDERVRLEKLKEHAIHLKKHIKELSSKEYWKQFDPSPEYVILYLPAEAFFSAALQVDPLLIEMGANQNVIVATPTTLIAILRAVAYGWKQENISRSAKEISILGLELYERLSVLGDHWTKLGRHLTQSVDAYNQSTASLESRVMVSARKFKELGAANFGKEIPSIEMLDKATKSLKTPELMSKET